MFVDPFFLHYLKKEKIATATIVHYFVSRVLLYNTWQKLLVNNLSKFFDYSSNVQTNFVINASYFKIKFNKNKITNKGKLLFL